MTFFLSLQRAFGGSIPQGECISVFRRLQSAVEWHRGSLPASSAAGVRGSELDFQGRGLLRSGQPIWAQGIVKGAVQTDPGGRTARTLEEGGLLKAQGSTGKLSRDPRQGPVSDLQRGPLASSHPVHQAEQPRGREAGSFLTIGWERALG